MSNLDVAVAIMGGTKAFTEKLQITRQTLYRWRKGTTLLPVSRVLQIEELTEGKVSRSDLRPDYWPVPENN